MYVPKILECGTWCYFTHRVFSRWVVAQYIKMPSQKKKLCAYVDKPKNKRIRGRGYYNLIFFSIAVNSGVRNTTRVIVIMMKLTHLTDILYYNTKIVYFCGLDEKKARFNELKTLESWKWFAYSNARAHLTHLTSHFFSICIGNNNSVSRSRNLYAWS